MSASPISPVVPARIGALLVPVGNIGRSKFQGFAEKLFPENAIRLGDISPEVSGDRTLFSPLAFPNGVMLYNFMTARPSDVHAGLAPYELFREAFVVVGIVDGSTFSLEPTFLGDDSNASSQSLYDFFESVEHEMIQMRQEYSEAFLVQPLVFDFTPLDQKKPPHNILTVPTIANFKSTTMKTVMCDLSARVLAEMTVLARSISSADFISSPMTSQATSPLKTLRKPAREDLQSDSGLQGRESHESVDTSRSRQRPAVLSAEERDRRRASSPVPPATLRRVERSVSPAPVRVNADSTNINALDVRERPQDRPPTSASARESSRDRRAVQSLIIGATDRANHRLKSRQGLIIGNLYLLSGRWSDALRELVDNATRAKVFGDLIWYAKGLENILVTMILLAWARIEFTIPPICYSNPEKYASTTRAGRSSSFTRSSVSTDLASDENLRSVTNLSVAIPDLVHTIIDAQLRAKQVGEDSLPQLAFSEGVIRLTHLLAVLHRCDSTLTPRHLAYLVRGAKLPPACNSFKMRLPAGAGRDIANLLFEAFPPELFASSMPLDEIITILSGMTAVLSLAGMYRKRAMIIREALSILIPRLIQARKVGAAELGIHPAASLAARHGLTFDATSTTPFSGPPEVEQGFHNLLVLLCNTFGVVADSDVYRRFDLNSRDSKTTQTHDVNLSTLAEVAQDGDRRQFGGFGLKNDVLRLSANFSEALPNFYDVVLFTSALLKTIGPGSAPQSDRLDHHIGLPREEQIRFASKIQRTLGVFKSTDIAHLEARYWDRFLVRDVELLQPEGKTSLTVLARSRLDSRVQSLTSPRHTGPFIFDSSKKESKQAAAPNVVVAGEKSDFVVTLQNLYDFDVIIERLDIVTEGVEFKSTSHSFTLGPRRRQQVLTSGVATTAGELQVVACRVKIQGCRMEEFPIYRESWSPMADIKIKETGLKALNASLSRPASLTVQTQGNSQVPPSVRCAFRTILAQPMLAISSMTLKQSNIDLFEGETKSSKVILTNSSESTSVDFLRVSFVHAFNDSATKAVIQDQTEGDRPLTRIEPMRWRRTASNASSISARKSLAIEIETLGISGLSESIIQVDYAYLGDMDDQSNTAAVYTRRAALSLQVSVKPAIQIEDITTIPAERALVSDSTVTAERALSLDLHNFCPGEVSTTVAFADASGRGQQTQTLSPNKTTRVFIPCPNLGGFAAAEHPTSRQPAQHIPAPIQQATATMRRAQVVDKALSITWKDKDTGRSGKVDLAAAYDTLLGLAPTEMRIELTLSGCGARQMQPFELRAPATFVVPVAAGVRVNARVTNCTARPIRPFVRFHLGIVGGGRPGKADSVAMDDVSKSLSFTGLLRQPLALLAPGASADVVLGVCPMARGRFGVRITAEEVQWEGLARQLAQGAAVAVLGSARCALAVCG